MSTTVSDPLVGRLLDRRYQVEAQLASGGMATVYTAHDTRLDRTVALKVMHRNLAEDDTFVSRFIREAQSAARLSHPNVVAVYDQGDDDGTVFLAMEHVAGRTLRDVLRERGRLRPREALEVLERVLSALAAAHRAGLVHRDVKPENVLISDEGRVKVADFGLARAVTASSHTRTTGLIIGTVAYLSPEQVERGVADARSDVYAAGILLYEMLVGDVPFRADTPIAVAYKHVHEDVPPPSATVNVSPVLDELVGYATDRVPDNRPDDAGALLADVAEVRRGLPDDPAGDASAGPRLAPADSEPTEVFASRRREAKNHTLVFPGHPSSPYAATGGSGDEAAPEPVDPGARKVRRGRGLVALVLVLALAVTAGALGWWFGAGRWTETPQLARVSASAAADKARAAGFETERKLAYHETVPKGSVASTDPTAGERIVRGGTITLFVSRGPERHAVPKLAGGSETDARKALAAAKLAVGEVTRRYHKKVAEDDVITTDPKSGKLLRRGTKVDLVVSRGLPPVSVPKVTGSTRSAAERELGARGLKSSATEVSHKTVPAGTVVRQSPGAGDKVAKGTTVRLVVSKGPPIVAVPDVRDRPVKQAKKTLESAGFEVRINHIPGGGNKVLTQNPRNEAPYGSTITLYVF
ncbi:MAG: Stk1 family PASTA domain-containing Ser/Thr kinase [Streptosporangiales bacterium]|nr:Stk1 family PASTA domain-containing Ser/Thr kinase [Streptosporangiales bacterium]